MSHHTLRISTEQFDEQMVIRLDGRVAGPWATELVRVWTESAATLDRRKTTIDIRNVTYVDEQGKNILRDIYDQTQAELLASTPWTRYLAEEVMRNSANHSKEEL
jgi:anti-anti-sigma regulatory factor